MITIWSTCTDISMGKAGILLTRIATTMTITMIMATTMTITMIMTTTMNIIMITRIVTIITIQE